MKLVDYSDSDASESENEGKAPSPPTTHTRQRAGVPREIHPKKQIIVNLPKPVRTDDDEPVRKRARPEGDAKGGLLSILPPPKRVNAAVSDAPKERSNLRPMNEESGGTMKVGVERSTPSTKFVPRSTQHKKGKAASKPDEIASAVSLFPLGPDLVSKTTVLTEHSNPSTYEPLIAQTLPPTNGTFIEPNDSVPDTASTPSTMSTVELDAFAAHILEGRHRKNRTIQIVDYNAAEIYAKNAADKASGLLQENVAPVRAIGTGRHQIHQLLNNVQDQKEALEEAFAEGRRVRKESAAKYGW